MTDQAILYTVAERIATITLNSPDTRNALPPEVGAEIIRLVRLADRDPAVKCILLQAVGENFSAGGNVKSFSETLSQTPEERYDQFEKRMLVGNRLPMCFIEATKPVVVATRGAVAGAGMALCLAADYVIAAESTFFLAAHVHIGLSIDCGLSSLLVASMGVKAAKKMSLLGERVAANDALALGIVTEVVSEADLEAATKKITDRLIKGPATAMAGTKMLLNRAAYPDFVAQLAEEARSIARCVSQDDFRKGVEGAISRKPAVFD